MRQQPWTDPFRRGTNPSDWPGHLAREGAANRPQKANAGFGLCGIRPHPGEQDDPMQKPRGRHFFANPGPTNIPDSVLRAMDRPSIDFNDPDFVAVYDGAFAGVKRVLRSTQHLFMYNAAGHGAWEASLTNLLSPGDTILVLESGYFSDEWANMARSHGL